MNHLTPFAERFWDRISPEPNSGCFLWMGATSQGYGRIMYRGFRTPVHRVAWQEAGRTLPPKPMVLRHKCDVACCVNPDHLIPGTHQDNVADKVARNRQAVGRQSPSAKLTEDDVRQIRGMAGSHRAIGILFDVSHNVVGRIKRRALWKYLDG